MSVAAVLRGSDIALDHCVLENCGGEVTLTPSEGALCSINGHECTLTTKLSQGKKVLYDLLSLLHPPPHTPNVVSERFSGVT